MNLYDVWIDSVAEFQHWFADRRKHISYDTGKFFSRIAQMHNEYEAEASGRGRNEYRYVMIVKGQPFGGAKNRQYKHFADMEILAIRRTLDLARRGRNYYSHSYINAAINGRKKNGAYTPEYLVFQRDRLWWDPGKWHNIRLMVLMDALIGYERGSRKTERQRAYSAATGDSRARKAMRKDLYRYAGEPTVSTCLREARHVRDICITDAHVERRRKRK